MIDLRTDAIRAKWVRQVRIGVRGLGYYFEPNFCSETGDPEPLVTAARLLGHLFVPSGTDSDRPVIVTQPSTSAPQWRPFDRKAAIGWHNDFSTRSPRPELSLSWIRRGDPGGPNGGAWRVASATAVIGELSQTREGKRLVADLSAVAEPFGYRDAGDWRPFRVIMGTDSSIGRRGLRFYRRALEEGACLRFDHVPERTREIITRVEEAADAVGQVLSASTGSLLIVDNRFSLHDRAEQQVTGPEQRRRQAWLCFVRRLHQPL